MLIFAGPNTAGKSTIAQGLTDKYQAFTDDALIVKKRNKTWYGYQMPADINGYIFDRTAAPKPIGAIFFLHKDTKLAIKEIEKKDVDMRLFMDQIAIGTVYKKHISSLFSFVAAIEHIYIMRFPKDINGDKFQVYLKKVRTS